METGLLINVNEGVVSIEKIERFEDYYKLVGCETFDITTRFIGGEKFALIVDDVGLWKEDPLVSAIYEDGTFGLVGNILILKQKGPDLVSLKPDQIQRILDNTTMVRGKPLLFLECR